MGLGSRWLGTQPFAVSSAGCAVLLHAKLGGERLGPPNQSIPWLAWEGPYLSPMEKALSNLSLPISWHRFVTALRQSLAGHLLLGCSLISELASSLLLWKPMACSWGLANKENKSPWFTLATCFCLRPTALALGMDLNAE